MSPTPRLAELPPEDDHVSLAPEREPVADAEAISVPLPNRDVLAAVASPNFALSPIVWLVDAMLVTSKPPPFMPLLPVDTSRAPAVSALDPWSEETIELDSYPPLPLSGPMTPDPVNPFCAILVSSIV